MNIDPKNKVTISLSFVWTLICIIVSATAFLVGAYAESSESPKRLDKVEADIVLLKQESQRRNENDMVNCLILQRIQTVVVPASYRIERKCEK